MLVLRLLPIPGLLRLLLSRVQLMLLVLLI
jgi:hypothetical protein